MDEAGQVDGGVYCKAPIFYFLRNCCAPALAAIFVTEFKNAGLVRQMQEEEEQSTNSERRIRNKNLYEFLDIVHKKGKRLEQKRQANQNKTLHLNNLRQAENVLAQVSVASLLTQPQPAVQQVTEILEELDAHFLINLLNNDILCFPFSEDIFEAILQIRDVRNEVFHPMPKAYKLADIEKILTILRQATKSLLHKFSVPTEYVSRIDYQCSAGSQPVIESLRREVHRQYAASTHHVLPTISYVGDGTSPSKSTIEDLEKFLAENKVEAMEETQPYVLCGGPGMGKSSVLRNLANKLASSCFPSFSLVLYFHSNYRALTRELFQQQMCTSLKNLAPQTVNYYGIEAVEKEVQDHSSEILLIMDWNIRNLRDIITDMHVGTWIVSYQGTPDPSLHTCILEVEPYNNAQVKNFLWNHCHDEAHFALCWDSFSKGTFKGLLKTPDMLHIFTEIGNCRSSEDLLQNYVRKKTEGLPDAEEQLVKVGMLAFDMIKRNNKYYKPSDLQGISTKVVDCLFEYNKITGASFKYNILEDFLAARYICAYPQEASKQWLAQIPLFKRVFRFACIAWCKDSEGINPYSAIIKAFLSCLLDLDMKGKASKKFNKSKRKSVGESSSAGLMEVDATSSRDDHEHFRGKQSFTRWSFLSKFLYDCTCNPEIVKILAEILSSKSVWHFKCKTLSEDHLPNLAIVLRKVDVGKKPLMIKLESGGNAETLCKVWKLLCSLPGLSATSNSVHLHIIHVGTSLSLVEKQLESLSTTIASTTSTWPLTITKYVGPLVCSETPEFFRCPAFIQLAVLDVFICDLQSFSEALSCTRLTQLKDVIIKLCLRTDQQEKALINSKQFSISKCVPLTLTVRYFTNFQDLLNKLAYPEHLRSLSIYDMYIHEQFKLNLSAFENLKCLFIKFWPGMKFENTFLEGPGCSNDAMEVDSVNVTFDTVKFMVTSQWVFQLTIKMELPKSLKRSLFRNMEFCVNSNIFSLMTYMQMHALQRLVLLDTNLTLTGVSLVLRSLAQQPKIEGDPIDQTFKKLCTIGADNSKPSKREIIIKKPRIDETRRKEKRANKPDGKEVIITSCIQLREHLFPKIAGKNDTETYEDLMDLINDCYRTPAMTFSFTCEDVVVRKDVCRDMRVHCPILSLDDTMVEKLNSASRVLWLDDLLHTLALAQYIYIDYSNLSLQGSIRVVQYLKSVKKEHAKARNAKVLDPFSLTVISYNCPQAHEECLLEYIRSETCLKQFNFRCCCPTRMPATCIRIKKTDAGDIVVNDDIRLKAI